MTPRAGATDAITRGDAVRALVAALSFVLTVGLGVVWQGASQAAETRSRITALDTRVVIVERTQPDVRELGRQMDSLRITIREALDQLRRIDTYNRGRR